MMTRTPRRRHQRGQTLVIFALSFLVVMGFASLAIDGSHVYLVHRGDQNAADAGALAGTNVLSKITTPITAAPLNDSDPAIKAVHDVVAANGIVTKWPAASGCEIHSGPNVAGKTSYKVTWFDTVPALCTATAGFAWKVTVQIPPPVPVGNCVQNPYDCVQVDVNDRVSNYLLGALGTPVTESFASAMAFAKQVVPGVNFLKVPPAAVWLYEAHGNTTCASTAAAQCFNRTSKPTKSELTCGGGGCPTLWVQPQTNATFIGIDGKSAVSTGVDQLALFSNGDVLAQGPTDVCDPYNKTACPSTVNPEGYAVTGGANLYCASKTPAVGTACNTTSPGNGVGLSTIKGSEASPPAPFTFVPVVPTAGPDCGALLLNGEAITASSFIPPSSTCAPKGTPPPDPYTILPGTYKYIVINHGEYTFERGLYDITGVAPVNTNLTGFANGIDHSRENNVADFDLCNAGLPTSCPNLTAGVWIGNGLLSSYAASPGNSSQCTLGQPQSGTQAGGGDKTIINGSGVSFRFEGPAAGGPTASGFVSTREVTLIFLDAPTPGSMPDIKGEPLLFDLENNGTIHLDSQGKTIINNTTVSSGFTGLVFQTESATAGGVEIDPSLSGISGKPALAGQVVAYSLDVFGTASGTAVDFSAGYGAATQVLVSTGRNEPQLITDNLGPTKYTIGENPDGTVTFTQFFADEWALDSYDTYFKINGGTPLFFSKPLWSTPNPPTQPPNNTAPDDTSPGYPDDAAPGKYTVVSAMPPNQHDWAYNGSDPSLAASTDLVGNYKFETKGFWTWGHEKVAAGGGPTKDPGGKNPASISLTFPKQPGSTVEIQGYVTDGDRCGDFATFDLTLSQPGGPGGGVVEVPGGNTLMQ